MKPTFSEQVIAWYDKHGRKDLPWQRDRDAYKIWVSEIMLQQTRVDTVIPYFENFIQRFPDVISLAIADEDEVLHHWTGLGYYARARNLHKAAQQIHSQYDGVFPNQLEDVIALPGIGRSTAAAILALSFNQAHAILDGNVKRVLARYFVAEGWPGKPAVAQQLWTHAEDLLPDERFADYTQAMMDLGATVCTRSKPDCMQCPVHATCQAYQQHRQADLPSPKPAKRLPQKHIVMAIVQHMEDQSIWLEKRQPTGIWGGLYSFPEFTDKQKLRAWLAKRDPSASYRQQNLAQISHTFSHFKLHMQPVLVYVDSKPNGVMEDDLGVWYKMSDQKIGLAAPVKKVLLQVLQLNKETTHDAHGAMCEA